MTTYKTDDNSVKKSYDSPRLVVYGDVRKITQGAQTGATDDHSGVGFHLTS